MNRDLLFGKNVQGDSYEPASPLVLRALKDYEVLYLTTFSAPTTSGGTGLLPAGELICVVGYRKGFPAATCMPLRYDALQESIVPENERLDAKYGGYYFVIKLDDLDEHFEQLSDDEVSALNLTVD